jgi:hypothetical protein
MFRFAMTSKQSRKAAVTRFVASIDMWNIGRFPVHTLLLGFQSLIVDYSASDLRRITSWRMPTYRGEVLQCSSLSFAEPILGNLTSLHALELNPGPVDANLPVGFVLDKCTALKRLYFRVGSATALSLLEKYVSMQPKLQAFAVQIMGYNETNAGRVAPLFAKLQHRPEIVSIITRDFEEPNDCHPGWALDAKRVILLDASRHSFGTVPEMIEWFNKSICAPVERCWKLNGFRLDPFSVDSLPVIAHLIAAAAPENMGSAVDICKSIESSVTDSSPGYVRAAAYYRVLMSIRDGLASPSGPFFRTLLDDFRTILIREISSRYQNFPNDTESQLDCIWLILPAIAASESELPFPLRLPARDLEWAFARIQEMTTLIEPPSFPLGKGSAETNLEYFMHFSHEAVFRHPRIKRR